jgi:hypothetical protein
MPLHDWDNDRDWDNVPLIWFNRLLDWVQPRLPEGYLKGNDLLVLHAAPTQLEADLMNAQAPLLEESALVGRYVLVENIHAEIGSGLKSSACRTRA